MKQISLAMSGFEKSAKRTRKREFLAEMDQVVPWAALEALIAPHYARGKTGRPPFALGAMLRIHFLQQWFGLSDPAMEEALHDVPLYCEFVGLDAGNTRQPDETTILRFRHLLEAHDLAPQVLGTVNAQLIERGLMLKTGTVVDALIDQRERLTASIRAKVEHPFRVIKCQFGHVKVRYRGLAKNTAQLITLFALSNLWMVRRRLLATAG